MDWLNTLDGQSSKITPASENLKISYFLEPEQDELITTAHFYPIIHLEDCITLNTTIIEIDIIIQHYRPEKATNRAVSRIIIPLSMQRNLISPWCCYGYLLTLFRKKVGLFNPTTKFAGWIVWEFISIPLTFASIFVVCWALSSRSFIPLEELVN
jgi:hypothetical protein